MTELHDNQTYYTDNLYGRLARRIGAVDVAPLWICYRMKHRIYWPLVLSSIGRLRLQRHGAVNGIPGSR